MKDRSHLFTAMSLSHAGAALLNPGRKLSSEAPMTSARVFHRPINVKIPSLTDSKTTRLKIFDQVSKQSFLTWSAVKIFLNLSRLMVNPFIIIRTDWKLVRMPQWPVTLIEFCVPGVLEIR